jgi:hypothetical protein
MTHLVKVLSASRRSPVMACGRVGRGRERPITQALGMEADLEAGPLSKTDHRCSLVQVASPGRTEEQEKVT